MSCCGNGAETGETIEKNVQEYYGKIVKTKDDLKTGTCMVPAKMSPKVKAAMGFVHEEVIKRNYGCGLPFPEVVEGCNILDLGSGTGRDAFVLSKMVGPGGNIVGVDMTQEQLDIANEYTSYHMEKFGYEKPNVEFKKGFVEDLKAAGIPDDYFDCVVSNCVINLSKDKRTALSEAFRVLKKGGEVYFSDIYSNQAIPQEAQKDKEAWGECLSGALSWKDLNEICLDLGFATPALVWAKKFPIKDERIEKLLGEVKFVAATYRIFKPDPDLNAEPAVVTYLGTIEEYPDEFALAKNLVFKKGDAVTVDAELDGILRASRYGKHFQIERLGTSIGNAVGMKQIEMTNPFCCAEDASGTSGGCC